MTTILHRPADGDPRALATDVAVADSLVDRTRGLMLRTLPDDGALVFPFDEVVRQWIHMVGVPTALDVVWTVDGVVTRVATLRAWADLARGRADTVIELPAGTADGVAVGDQLEASDS